ncbi:MAG: mannitol dehydrogenase family protein [Spirochaetaceae bacterium]|jgi:fructuronate reductase|nr:mannitol dehydrogenase family protein [Spirochaetaceae bacterium]
MELNGKGLEDKGPWEKAGFRLPQFDREAMIRATEECPQWVHFGAGNIFRAFPAALQQTLLEQGIEKTGIIVAEGYDGEIIDRAFLLYDNLSLAVTLKADGTIEKRVIASIARALRLDKPGDFEALRGIFRSPSLQMVSFTITEKGYSLGDSSGGRSGLFPEVEADFREGPAAPKSYLGRLAALCYERYRAGKFPLALVSMDNCSHNGDKLFQGVEPFVIQWVEKRLVEGEFLDYIRNPAQVSFPWSMIDKITPRPDEGVRKMLEALGFTDTAGQVTAKNTYIAPFVNAEEAQYLVIEDAFPAGRPALERAGVLFTNRDTVNRVEKMKVCTCLNPLHTALAVFGCLLGYTTISAEMKDRDLVRLVEQIGYNEGLPVVVDPGILSPQEFIDQVLRVRFPNPFMPDTPQRIATDTSQKISIRFGETIKAYLADPKRKVEDLKLIPLVLAAWLRYLRGVDDQGAAFTVSPDPLYETLYPAVAGINLGQKGPFHQQLEPILANPTIFGVNLYEAGLGEQVETYFEKLFAGPGAVRNTLAGCVKRAE